MGYSNRPAPERLTGRPNYVGYPRGVLAYLDRVRRNVGEGTYIRVEITRRGELVPRQEVEQAVSLAEYRTA
jgi:hypothetical protein